MRILDKSFDAWSETRFVLFSAKPIAPTKNIISTAYKVTVKYIISYLIKTIIACGGGA